MTAALSVAAAGFGGRGGGRRLAQSVRVAGVDAGHVAVDDNGVAAAQGLGDDHRLAGLQSNLGPGGNQDRLAIAL